MLVDGEQYFDAFVRACERAERSILILAWDFDSRMSLRFDASNRAGETLGDFLNRLCAARPKLRIHILDWDFPLVYGTDREYSPIFGLEWKPHRHIDFRFDDTHPVAGSHHQKVVAIDDKLAFAGGLDLTNKRWDSPQHAPDDPRRTFHDKPYPPFHDAMIAVDDEAGRKLAELARSRWQAATGRTLKPVQTRGDPWPEELAVEIENVDVSISCTLPPTDGKEGVHHIEALYLDMIARARDYIYIENQYFTSDKVGKALLARLGDPGGPEIIVNTRLLSHGWLEENTMHVLRTRLVRELRAADKHGRFRAYYPHVEGLCEGTCLDLHSKVLIVDDEWMRIGSSNISNRSMGVDTECDVTVEARGRPDVAKAIRAYRDRLLAEHAGVEQEALERELESAGSIAAAVEKVGSPGRRMMKLEAPEIYEAMLAAAAIGDMEKPVALDALVKGFAPENASRSARRKPWIGIAAIAAVLVGLALLWRYTPLADIVTADNANRWAEALAEYWWAPALVVLAYIPAMFVMFPRWLITLAAVFAFGPREGFAIAMVGAVVSGTVGFFAGRMVSRDRIRRLAGPKMNRLNAFLQKRGLFAVTVVRLVPVAPFIVVNVVMGAMRVRVHHFMIGTFLGMLPGTLAATVLSDQISAMLGDPSRVNLGLVAAAVLAIATLAYGGHRWLNRTAA